MQAGVDKILNPGLQAILHQMAMRLLSRDSGVMLKDVQGQDHWRS